MQAGFSKKDAFYIISLHSPRVDFWVLTWSFTHVSGSISIHGRECIRVDNFKLLGNGVNQAIWKHHSTADNSTIEHPIDTLRQARSRRCSSRRVCEISRLWRIPGAKPANGNTVVIIYLLQYMPHSILMLFVSGYEWFLCKTFFHLSHVAEAGHF